LESEEDKEALKNNVIRFAVCTKKDAALQAQVTKEELHSLSHKYSIPIYLVSNTPTEPPFNHNKDMIKILNDIAECLIAEGNFTNEVVSLIRVTFRPHEMHAIV
jgi:hypothetical protein